LADLEQRNFTTTDLEKLPKQDRRLLDQFAYRYTRLQDDMGARLIPAILSTLGEDIAPMATLDRLNRLEQLGWLPVLMNGLNCAAFATNLLMTIREHHMNGLNVFSLLSPAHADCWQFSLSLTKRRTIDFHE